MLSLIKVTVLNSKKFINFFATYLLIIFCLFITVCIVHTIAFNNLYNKYNNVVQTIEDGQTICENIKCSNVVYVDDYTTPILVYNLDKEMNMVFTKENIIYLVSVNELVEYQVILLYNFLMCFTIFYIIFGTLFTTYIHRRELNIDIQYKKLTEVKLQTELTESLHHELGVPVAIIDTLLLDLYTKMYMQDTGRVFNIEEIPNLKTKYKRSVDKVAFDHYEHFVAATDRIKAILKLISNNKHIKYNNGTVSLYKIFSNICNSINGFRLTKFKTTYINQDLMDKYATGHGLDNGLHMNIINIMVTNSLEAGANHITFRTEYYNEQFILLYITDNGVGIRDKNNKISKTNEIFNYGYTIKERENTRGIKDCKFICKIIKLMLNLKDNRYHTTRGVGLSLVKNLITKAGGHVKVVDTSNTGTTFELKIPIKPRLEKHID